jgi:hypothetical protein
MLFGDTSQQYIDGKLDRAGVVATVRALQVGLLQ